MSTLDPRIRESLRAALAAVGRRGDLLPPTRLQQCYATFREQFGPARLKSLDGKTLLEALHTHGNRESLVYWLEFKNDEEFPGPKFGSIAGGTAHKFGLFRRKHTAQWVKGSVESEENISESEAIVIARRHRDQLLAGAALLEKLPADADDDDYRNLQERMTQIAPDPAGQAWRHKYFSLLYPEKLDDYHSHRWQRFNLIKLLQLPPPQEGLYASGGRFVRLAAELGWPLNHLTTTLNERNRRPYSYWRIGVRPAGDESNWPDMKAGGYAAIGWAALGDLSNVLAGGDPKEKIAALLEENCDSDAKAAARKAIEIRNFAWLMTENDVVLAADGERILGVGHIKGPYRFDATPPADVPHRRDVEWLSNAEWKLPFREGLQSTVWALRRDDRNLVAIEELLLELSRDAVPLPSETPETPEQPVRTVTLLGGIPGRLQAILERKGQAILHGPPGTGKTYWARKVAQDLAALTAFGRVFDELGPEEAVEVTGNAAAPGLVRCCTFHPAYNYENFIEGFRAPPGSAGPGTLEPRDGIFKQLCRDASSQAERRFFLVLDEINRRDIPRVFGELLTLLERDKRGLAVTLPLSGEIFSVPQNIFVIGTLSSADQSVSPLDAILRRRFGFMELAPDSSTLAGAIVGDALCLGPWLDALNAHILEQLGRNARHLQIGHAWFLEGAGRPVTELATFARIVADEIVPLLEEYCRGDYGALAGILGKSLVDETQQRVRAELFEPARREELLAALLAPFVEPSLSSESATRNS